MQPRSKSDGSYVVRDAPSDIIRGRPSRPPPGPEGDPPRSISSLPPAGEALLDTHLPAPPVVPSDGLQAVARRTYKHSTLRPRTAGHTHDVVRGVTMDALGSSAVEDQKPDDLKSLLRELVAVAPGEEHLIVRRLLRLDMGPTIDALEHYFPGPLWFDRRHSQALPEASQVSAIASAMSAFGVAAVPAIARLLVDRGPEPRFYAAVVARALPHPHLLRPLGRVALGSDGGVRSASLAAIEEHRHYPEFESLLEWLRSVAGSQPSRQVWRVRSLAALAELGDARALDVMLETLGDRDRSIARAAHEALVRLTAHDLGSLRFQWKRWHRTQGNRPRLAWLVDGLADRRPKLRMHALRELEHITGIRLGLSPDSPRASFLEAQAHYSRWWQTSTR